MSEPKKDKPTEQPDSPASRESAHRLWLAGLGALAVVGEEGDRLFKQLVRKGADMEQGERYEFGEEVAEATAVWSDYELIDAGAAIAARHPDLRGKTSYLRSLLAWEATKSKMVHELAGGPRRVVTAADLQEEQRVRIASEAIADIWQEEVLEPREVAVVLGAKKSNREKASSLRKRSSLLGLPHGRGFLYPGFQLDAGRREVRPEVQEVNRILDAADDPWGVASWWVSINDRLGGRPLDLVGSARARDLVEAAKAATAPIG